MDFGRASRETHTQSLKTKGIKQACFLTDGVTILLILIISTCGEGIGFSLFLP